MFELELGPFAAVLLEPLLLDVNLVVYGNIAYLFSFINEHKTIESKT